MANSETPRIPDGLEIFAEERSKEHFAREGEPWIEHRVEVKPTGGKDARNKKKE